MTISQMIAMAYLDPLRRFGAVLRIFWPAAVILIALGVGFYHLFSSGRFLQIVLASGLFGAVLLNLAIALLFGSVFASGLYVWHRHLVLDEPPRRLSLIPERAAHWLFLRWLGLGVLFYVFYMIASAFLSPLVFKLIGVLHPLASPSGMARLQLASLVVFTTIIMLASVLFALALSELALFLPLVSVESEAQIRASQTGWSVPSSGLRGAIIATIAPPMITGTALPMLAGFPGSLPKPVFIAASFAGHALSFYAILVFASLLSHYYRERVRSQLPKVPAPAPP